MTENTEEKKDSETEDASTPKNEQTAQKMSEDYQSIKTEPQKNGDSASAESPRRKEVIYWASGIGAAAAFIIICLLLLAGSGISCNSEPVKNNIVAMFQQKVLSGLGLSQQQIRNVELNVVDVQTLGRDMKSSRCQCLGNLEIGTSKGKEKIAINYQVFPHGDTEEIHVELDSRQLFMELVKLGTRHSKD